MNFVCSIETPNISLNPGNCLINGRNTFKASVQATCSGTKYYTWTIGSSTKPETTSSQVSDYIYNNSVAVSVRVRIGSKHSPTRTKTFYKCFDICEIKPWLCDDGPIHGMEGSTDLEAKLFPNPTTSSSTLNYSIDKASKVSLDIYDLQGRLIKNVFSGEKAEGNHQATIDVSNLSSGTYLYILKSNDLLAKGKLIKK